MKTDRLLLWSIFSIAAVLFVFAIYSERSSAALTFNTSSGTGIPSFDLSKLNLPKPLLDLINGIRGTGNQVIQTQIPSYTGTNLESVRQSIDQFLRGIPVVSQVYSIIEKIIVTAKDLLGGSFQALKDFAAQKGLHF